MSHPRFYCSEESKERGEQIFGTVALVRSWMLLEYSSVWRRHAIDESRLIPDAVKHHLRKLERSGQLDRILLIRQEHRRPPPIQCYRADSSALSPRLERSTLPSYEHLIAGGATAERVDDPLFAVCTHGRHDKCCAKFGLPVFCAMQEAVGNLAWECSHVGGDRFAGNVVVFPYGIYYGRVTPEDVPVLVEETRAGNVWLPGYRGRSVYPKAVQIAEVFARSETGHRRIDDFRPLDQRRTPDGHFEVDFQLAGEAGPRRLRFRRRSEVWRQRLTCEAASESDVPQYELLGHGQMG